ncbi:MAG: M23 family metallopeptidase [Treponema sp.]|jgi:murein DD-endopeptidase MepM/ murein hydrolase activator NlpD|nr:M23 family metallopeptidase [Treponema sp.]
MASVHEYKRLENNLVQKVVDVSLIIAQYLAIFFKKIGHFLTRRYTVVFVPHSEKRVYNLHITIISIFCFLLVVSGIVGAFLWWGASYSSTMYTMAGKDGRLKDTQASLDQLRDETAMLLREARSFENALSGVLSALGVGNNNSVNKTSSGDLSSFLGIKETPDGLLQEVDDVRRLSSYLSQAVEPIREIGTLLDSQSTLFTEIPSIWPVKNGLGRITMFFGQNLHPIHGQPYIHMGIDISTHRYGDPVVVTADGQVVTVDYDAGYGNYMIVRHKHGYYTRYAHLQSFNAKIGQRVQQNEVIAYIGNTGVSTGPHLHYEVHVGSDLVDPYRYINIRSTMARQKR